LRLLPLGQGPEELAFRPDDVLLVTGGGKGIAAECALALARPSRLRLVVLGRSDPATDPELAANLDRMRSAGSPVCYLRTDVADAEAVQAAVREAQREVGPITAVLHGAGCNVPQPLRSLDTAACLHTLAPKVWGARHVLAAIDPNRLRLFVTFGSL